MSDSPPDKSPRADADAITTCMPMARLHARKVSSRYGVPIDDAESEAMLALARARRTFDPARGEWVHHAWCNIRRHVGSWARAVSRKRTAETASAPSVAAHAAARAAEAPDTASTMDASAVAEVARSLPLIEAVVCRWYYGLEGHDPLSLREIAAALGRSHEYARDVLARAEDRIRKRLARVRKN